MQMQLPSIRFNDGGEEKVLFKLPEPGPSDLTSVCVFAMPKAGSVMLDGIMRELSQDVGLTYVSIMQEFFNLGLPDKHMPAQTKDIFIEKGYCYGGFRYFPRRFEIPILSVSKPILLVRDPRDMLVSHYFSMRESHPEPGKTLKTVNSNMSMREAARAMEINQYTRYAAETFRRFLTHYRLLLCEPYNAKVYRYEDIIYEKENWVEDIVDHFGWNVSSERARSLGRHFDIIPEVEDANQHVRQVHPGNYRTKLSHDAVSWLDDYFAEEMAFFGYEAGKK